MSDTAITLEEVERLIAERRSTERFSPALEAKLERETGARRARFLANVTLRTTLIYNCFLLGDYLLAPDTFVLATVMHLAVVTPWMLLVAHLLPSTASPRWREALAGSISVAMIAQILVIFTLTASPYATHYFYFAPVVVLSVGSLQRIDARCALRLSVIVFAMLAAATIARGQLPLEIAFAHTMTYAICAGVMMNSNHLVVREQRRLYLLSLRDRLRADLSDNNANVDALTGLANRRFLERRARELWAKPAGNVAAIILDADHFKTFNDRYGHTRGDACLKRIASCAMAELRDHSDLAVRLGGEEFLLLLADADADVAEMVAERIRAAVAALGIPHEDNPFGVVTASFGVASVNSSQASFEQLVEAADAALYRAKRAGRNRTRLWTDEAPLQAA